jgi:hypothetical protein
LEDALSAVKNLKTLLQEDLDELKALRDEARLQLHLAGKDAKAHLGELEDLLEHLESRLMHDGRAQGINATLRLGNRLKKGFLRFKNEGT